MNIFVTGGTGFIGTHVIRRLIESDNSVLALARSESAASKLREMGATPVLGDLQSIETWKSDLKGCDVVVHCAAPVEFWGPWQKYEQEIVLASKQLLEAAYEAGVEKFIHLSSESALQDKTPLVGIDESKPYPEKPNSFYGAAKKLAEIEFLGTENDIDVIILRPTFVWGEGAAALAEIADRARAGSFLWAGNGSSAFEAVHVTNLAEAVLLAVRNGKGKSVYFVTDDEPATFREFFSAFFDSVGIAVPTKTLPNWLIKSLAWVVESLWRTMGIKPKPPLTSFEWAFIGMPRQYNISKIKRDLGYHPIISRRHGFLKIKSSVGLPA
jgi:nucleoside-diphosphate-sugar epimerase